MKLPDIVQPEPGLIAKSLEQMFGDKSDLSAIDLAKLKENQEVLLAEIAAIEEESKIVDIAQQLAQDHAELIGDKDSKSAAFFLELARVHE